MHEVEIYRGSDRTLIRSLEIAMRPFSVEVHVRPLFNEAGEQLRAAFGNEPIFRVILTPVRAIASELLNELRRVPEIVLRHAEGFVEGYRTARGRNAEYPTHSCPP